MVEKKKAAEIKAPVKAPAEVQQPDAKGVRIVKTSRFYQLVEPPESKSQKELFKIPDDAVGRASKNWILLFNARKEISDHLNDAGAKLIQELRNAKRQKISFQVGAAGVVTLFIKHVSSKEVIAIEK
jgi:hypothetical protein